MSFSHYQSSNFGNKKGKLQGTYLRSIFSYYGWQSSSCISVGALAAPVEADPEVLVSRGDTEGSQILQHPLQVMNAQFISHSRICIQQSQYFQKKTVLLPRNNRQKEGVYVEDSILQAEGSSAPSLSRSECFCTQTEEPLQIKSS